MDPYSDVDPIIEARVRAAGSTLFRKWAGQPARYFHLPGEPPFECFQISVEPPAAGGVEVFARAIDTNDGTTMDLSLSLKGPLHDLDAMLTKAIEAIENWKMRPQRNSPPSGMRFRQDGTQLPPNRNH